MGIRHEKANAAKEFLYQTPKSNIPKNAARILVRISEGFCALIFKGVHRTWQKLNFSTPKNRVDDERLNWFSKSKWKLPISVYIKFLARDLSFSMSI